MYTVHGIYIWSYLFSYFCRSETVQTQSSHYRDSTCPLCRGPLEDPSRHWVVPDPKLSSPEDMPSLVLGLVGQVAGANVSEMVEDDSLVTSTTSDGYMLVSHKPPSPT